MFGLSKNERLHKLFEAPQFSLDSELEAKVKRLIADGADINSQDRDGKTILYKLSYTLGRKSNSFLIFNLLEKFPEMDINAKNNDGLTALHGAVSAQDIDSIAILLACGANINAQDNDGQTPIYKAFFTYGAERAEILRIFLLKGVDLNIKTRDGGNILFDYILTKDKDVVEFLIKNGFKFEADDPYNAELIRQLTKNGPNEMLDFIFECADKYKDSAAS